MFSSGAKDVKDPPQSVSFQLIGCGNGIPARRLCIYSISRLAVSISAVVVCVVSIVFFFMMVGCNAIGIIVRAPVIIKSDLIILLCFGSPFWNFIVSEKGTL